MGSEWHTSFAAKSQIHGNPSFVDARLCLDPENEEVSLFPHETLRYMGFIWFYMIFWWSFTSMYIYIYGFSLEVWSRPFVKCGETPHLRDQFLGIQHGFTMDSPWIHHGFTMDQQVSWGLRWYMMVCGYFMLFSDAPSPDWGIGRWKFWRRTRELGRFFSCSHTAKTVHHFPKLASLSCT